ncbi:MAG: hypothetical protein U0531_06175 [Dehalococcoidia bacterium]
MTARMAALYYATSEIVRRLLDFTFSTKDTTFWTGVQEMTSTSRCLRTTRDAVTEKLNPRPHDCPFCNRCRDSGRAVKEQ